MSPLPNSVLQTALLFEESDSFDAISPDWSAFLRDLNDRLRGTTPPFAIQPEASVGPSVALSNQRFAITVEYLDQPLELDRFLSVLSNTYYRDIRPELADAVHAHQRAILISVSPGHVNLATDPLTDLGNTNLSQDQAAFEFRLRIAQIAALQAMQPLMPGIVHWGQSDQLFRGPEFRKLAAQDFALPLYIHPGFESIDPRKGARAAGSVSAHGATHLIGKHVEVSEDIRPMIDSYETCLAFIARCRATGRLPVNGETFKHAVDADPMVVLNLPPTAQHPEGTIRLARLASDDPLPRTSSRQLTRRPKSVMEHEAAVARATPVRTFSLSMMIIIAIFALASLTMVSDVSTYLLPTAEDAQPPVSPG